ncbi:hypothetical protein CGT68_17805 [Vibrio cholerae]|uniref:hypothetical protein n=1 Tax=Vibrio cholerae TaxID=666 RepID=UPI000BA97BF8|nr:hypothetical protein [Vibrio cholerae]PAS39878.1 hypothetical protein CGT68_17805 [Vibrio cholerae]PAS40345.1 hypothetical protein CGT69_14795 [Vibrio cholerae]
MKKLNVEQAAAQQTTMNVDSFTPTPISEIVEKYAESFKPAYKTKEGFIETFQVLHNKVTHQIRVWEKFELTEGVQRLKEVEIDGFKVGYLCKKVSFECGVTLQAFGQTIEALILQGWRCAGVEDRLYTKDIVNIVMIRPDSFDKAEAERIEKLYPEYVEFVTNKQRADYFNVDKVSEFVENFQATEREEYLKARSESLSTILSKYTK